MIAASVSRNPVPTWARFLPRIDAAAYTSHHNASRSAESSFRLAVVGAGPAGFYTAQRVMSRLPNCHVDMYEALPVPFGLVRHGVAPDHPEVKNCQEKFSEIATSARFTYIGNVSVGSHEAESTNAVELHSILRNYDSVVFSYGASEDKSLGIPGEKTLKGIYSARQFVGWYNGHPACADVDFDLSQGEEVVIVGQGNVALDVGRILLEDIDVLRKTDITENALAELSRSRVKRVHIVGRRGPLQASFTIKEVRELMKLRNVAFDGVQRSLIPDDIKGLPRAARRLMEVLVRGTPDSPDQNTKSWSLDSCLAPEQFMADAQRPDRVTSTRFGVTKLNAPFDPMSRVESTGHSIIMPSDIVFRSVGYKSTSLRGFTDGGIQFDENSGTLMNDGFGRLTRSVFDKDSEAASVQQVPGLYCSGWLKNGPTGVIASTMQDAFTTAEAIVQDWTSGKEFLQKSNSGSVAGWEQVRADLPGKGSDAVAWSEWDKIDEAERKRGQSTGKPREKFTKTSDMLSVAKS